MPGITVQYGGTVTLNKEISGQVSKDLRSAELVSLPIVLVLLVIIFGSLVSAGLPLAVGILGIVGASAVLRSLTTFVSVSVFALNLVTVLGLGLAVDYALFVVSRFREELDRQPQSNAPSCGRWQQPVARSPSPASRSPHHSHR